MELEEKIIITQKELPSGKCQVKFTFQDEQVPMYGYLLTQEPKPVGEIIEEITKRMHQRMLQLENSQHFSITNHVKDDHQFYLYSA
ncbi:hypothetical protein [Mongoliitalea daihaiensis]|uniref:hypothetical protein n=1 Tax=Mongoliitalea daihaiensis TaxID=2782006 RepID=UPI001F1D9CC1|nr:hypothetical protein [Mongoliitalea daihaiensis]UJP64593.1 hypothetical protein IPZ59_17590 [Mongoliitalea daihaiensis]